MIQYLLDAPFIYYVDGRFVFLSSYELDPLTIYVTFVLSFIYPCLFFIYYAQITISCCLLASFIYIEMSFVVGTDMTLIAPLEFILACYVIYTCLFAWLHELTVILGACR